MMQDHAPAVNALDRAFGRVPAGPAKIRAILIARAGTLREWAGRNALYPEHVSRHLRGVQRYQAVTDALARELEIRSADVDQILGYDAKNQDAGAQ